MKDTDISAESICKHREQNVIKVSTQDNQIYVYGYRVLQINCSRTQKSTSLFEQNKAGYNTSSTSRFCPCRQNWCHNFMLENKRSAVISAQDMPFSTLIPMPIDGHQDEYFPKFITHNNLSTSIREKEHVAHYITKGNGDRPQFRRGPAQNNI